MFINPLFFIYNFLYNPIFNSYTEKTQVENTEVFWLIEKR